MKKVLSLLAVLALALVAIPAALAVGFDTTVKINNHEVDDATTVLDVERGETLELDLTVEADEDVEDLKWNVWIGGYEDYLNVQSKVFNLDANITNTNAGHLSIGLPSDMDADDTYKLHVELINGEVEHSVFEGELKVHVSKARHLVTVDDVIAPATVEAGEDVAVKVRVNNMGSYEEDVKITVGVPDLGVSAIDFVDDLAELDLDAGTYEDYDNTKTVTLVLNIPEDAAAGEHDLVVELSYNRGRETTTETVTLTVAGEAAPAVEPVAVEGVITVDATTKSLAQGEEKAYKLAFANLGGEAQLYTVRVAGTQLWADAKVEPSLVAVPAGEVVEAFVYLKAHENAELGNHIFTLQVSSGSDLVKEVVLGATVTEKTAEPTPAANWLQGNSTLKLAFVGLVVLLVIVGLFIAFRKLKEDEDYPLEPKDGQTYY